MERCELFPRFHTEAALEFCLERYCHGPFETCARYRFVQLHGRKPPSDLLPNGRRLGGPAPDGHAARGVRKGTDSGAGG